MTNHESGNRIIGKFDGREEGYDEHGKWQPFQYHTSWSWLMPVVEKIDGMDTAAVDCRLTIERHECRIYYNTVGMIYEWAIAGNSKIDSVWSSVVRFINWYNTQKTITHE